MGHAQSFDIDILIEYGQTCDVGHVSGDAARWKIFHPSQDHVSDFGLYQG